MQTQHTTVGLIIALLFTTATGCTTLRKQQTSAKPPVTTSSADGGSSSQALTAPKLQAFEERRSLVQLDAAKTRLRVGDSNGAILLLSRILGRDEANEEARSLLVEALVTADRVPEAEQLLRQQLERDPGRADVHHELGMLLETSGHAAAAAEHFRRAVNLDPTNSLFRMSLGS